MEYDITALKRKMLVKYPFFGSVVTNVKFKENKNIKTAGTDGETIYYNPDYISGLSVEEQTFVLAHEVCHIAFNHIMRSEGKDPRTWNIATDAVINQFLKRDGLPLAEGVVDMEEAINYDAEKFYEKLLKEQQEKQQQQGPGQGQDNQKNSEQQQGQGQSGSGQGTGEQNQPQTDEDVQLGEDQEGSSGGGSDAGDEQETDEEQMQQGQGQASSGNSSQNQNSNNQSSQNQNSQGQSSNGDSQNQQSPSQSNGGSEEDDKDKQQDVGHDTHSMWEDAVKKQKEENKKTGKKEGLLDKLLGKDKKEKSEHEKKQEELEKLGEKDAFKQNIEDRKKQLEDLKKAIMKQASQAGSSTNEEEIEVTNIGVSKPIIDWRYALREAIKYDVDWSYQNATIEDGVIVPHLEELPMPETEIVIDTSGSINQTLLKNFLRECKNILKHSKLKVGFFDTKFYGFHEIRTEEDIENLPFRGGGGTSFNAAVEAFSRRVENKIIFTDGEASMPEMPLDAIWIVFGREKINPKGGRVIHITPEQLDRLCSLNVDSETKGRLR